MPKNLDLPWVDLFEKSFFQGRLVRLRANGTDENSTYTGDELPHFGSMIIGPRAAVELARPGRINNVRLPELTVLPDTSKLTNGTGLQFLRLARIKPLARKARR
jgi:hypothetical protein